MKHFSIARLPFRLMCAEILPCIKSISRCTENRCTPPNLHVRVVVSGIFIVFVWAEADLRCASTNEWNKQYCENTILHFRSVRCALFWLLPTRAPPSDGLRSFTATNVSITLGPWYARATVTRNGNNVRQKNRRSKKWTRTKSSKTPTKMNANNSKQSRNG